ncbi:MAG: U32 family peptidase [Lachnospiraceae bacterium]|nr:U32 family peptidase [Lachnospiraceae bacterium]
MGNAEDKRSQERQPGSSAALSDKRRVPELLAPAGEAEAAYGAIAAGADAVYLGAEAFSARAFAKNLGEEELLSVLDYAHLFGRKIYLACNILMRDKEIPRLCDILDPLYERGLDGVIVQDLGLLFLLRGRYPGLELHASTQMGILSAAGAEWLKERGVSRVVPGRELSLEELRAIKACGIEVECFIHGAMCYSYSGSCLMSSVAGGRSGNRGRCAGPCRQPYRVADGQSGYLLSMKDMWSLEHLDELLDAGVDSLKIEGRMKAPEYAAGVTAVYRKYLDRYAKGLPHRVEEADRECLQELYLRSGRQEGYLHKHNGRDMISLRSPAYDRVSEIRKQEIRRRFIGETPRRGVELCCYAHAGQELVLTAECGGITVSGTGAVAERAMKRATTAEEIEKQLRKSGDTAFRVESLHVETDGVCFIPLSVLNGLRRETLCALQEELLKPYARTRRIGSEKSGDLPEREDARERSRLLVSLPEGMEIAAFAERSYVDGLILELDPFLEQAERSLAQAKGKPLYLKLPRIIRQKHAQEIREKIKKAAEYAVSGIYCGSVDGLALASGAFSQKERRADGGLYAFNSRSEAELLRECAAFTCSREQSGRELADAIRSDAAELIVYGRTPLMYSANCLQVTTGGCRREAGILKLWDEKGHCFPVRPVHRYCYNVIYNCVPLSLHREIGGLLRESRYSALRLEFTDETEKEALAVLDAFGRILEGKEADLPFGEGETTRGAYRKGAE